MKSKILKRCVAIMLCMVMVLSGSGYLLAETLQGESLVETSEANPDEGVATTAETEEQTEDATVEVEIPEQQEEAEVTPEPEVVQEPEAVQESEAVQEPEQQVDPIAETPAEVPTEEQPEEETPKPILQLTYEDDNVKVIVDAARAGNIPDGATLSVTPIEKKEISWFMSAEEKAKAKEVNERYELTEKKLQEKAENEEYEIAGFLAYDITFVDADGNKMEPNGDVKVSMEYKKAVIPEEVKQAEAEAAANNDEYKADVTLMHLEEYSDGTVKEVVDMVADENEVATVDTTTTSKVRKAEFVTDSFSTYTVTWTVEELEVKITAHYGYEDGEGQFVKFDEAATTQIPEVKKTKKEIILGDYSNTDVFEKDGYIYTKVYMSTSGKYSDKSECYSLRIKKDDDDYFLQKKANEEADRQNVGGAIKSGEIKTVDVYYVYEKVDPLTTVETVDHSSDGITMRMIDYNTAANGINIGGGYGDGTIKQNLLQRVLKDGYPVTAGGASLSSLFSGGTTVNHLFRKDIYDATGYYEYSCFENYAYLGNGTDFTVYNQIGTPNDSESYYFRRGNFMPYNEIVAGKYSSYTNNYDENGKELAEGDARKDEKLYKTQGDNNFYFGMYVEADFTQQKDGKVTHNGTKSPMRYEFNGDDDLWVYIDDVLILDIGGIHDAHSGYIDFATGEVGWYDCTTSEHLNPQLTTTTIKAMFQEAGKFPDGTNWDDNKVDDYFRGNTFKDYTTHTFKMFYMERGAGASNLHVKFNLPIVPNNTVNVQKVVEDENGNEVDYAEDIDFCFKIKVDGNDYANHTYVIVENGQETEVTGVTDENGCFTLKHTQTARFKNIPENYKYQVQELGAFLNGYEVQVNGVEVWTPQDDGGGEIIPSADSGEISVGAQPTAVFINTVKNTATLSISKNLKDGKTDENKEFSIQMRLNNQIYTGKYTIGDTQYTCENGIIKIKAGQTATISGLPYGVAFDVQELLDGSYLPTYAVTGKAVNILLPEFNAEGKNTNDVSSASAQMIGDCRVTVTNDEVETGTGTTNIVVVKNWMNRGTYELPPYVEVTLYVDTNSNGVFDDADTPVAGAVTKQLREENGWRAEWNDQAADTDYVVKETYPLGYELYETSIDNSLSDIVKIGDRNTPNNNTMFNIGKNNILLVKEKGDQYFLWSSIDLKLDQDDINEIVGAIKDTRLEGAGNLDSTNISYKFGITDQEGIGLTKNDNGWTLSFSNKSNWAMFWDFSYTRNQTVTLTNNLDEDANTSLIVNKEWVGDVEATRPESITVQLYQNDEAYGYPIEITAEQNWEHEFTELPFYTNNGDGTFTKNVYTVKETKVGSETVEAGMASDYQSSERVNDDGSITIINTKKWQIIKVSENSKDYVLAGAVFTLETADKTNVYYGVSGNDGVINWYTDVACTELYNENFPDGIYNLFETKAPAGYMLSSERWTINMENGCPALVTSTIKGDLSSVRKDGKDTFYFENTPLYDLPSTGGTGIFLYTIGGILLMMAAALILYKNKCREVLNK